MGRCLRPPGEGSGLAGRQRPARRHRGDPLAGGNGALRARAIRALRQAGDRIGDTAINPLPALSLLETRVLGTLAEKQHTVPDSYPLTLNALVSGCNQKTSRDPVIEATEPEVQASIDNLKKLNLVMETSGGRVSRHTHNLERVLQVPSQ